MLKDGGGGGARTHPAQYGVPRVRNKAGPAKGQEWPEWSSSLPDERPDVAEWLGGGGRCRNEGHSLTAEPDNVQSVPSSQLWWCPCHGGKFDFGVITVHIGLYFVDDNYPNQLFNKFFRIT